MIFLEFTLKFAFITKWALTYEAYRIVSGRLYDSRANKSNNNFDVLHEYEHKPQIHTTAWWTQTIWLIRMHVSTHMWVNLRCKHENISVFS